MHEILRLDCLSSYWFRLGLPDLGSHGHSMLLQARRPEMDMMVSGGQIVDAIVKLLQDEEAAQAWG